MKKITIIGYEVNNGEVNDSWIIEEDVFLDADVWEDNNQLLSWLRGNFIKKGIHLKSLSVEGDSFASYVDYKGVPILELRVEGEY